MGEYLLNIMPLMESLKRDLDRLHAELVDAIALETQLKANEYK